MKGKLGYKWKGEDEGKGKGRGQVVEGMGNEGKVKIKAVVKNSKQVTLGQVTTDLRPLSQSLLV